MTLSIRRCSPACTVTTSSRALPGLASIQGVRPDDVQRLFGDVFGPSLSSGWRSQDWVPAVDVRETGEDYSFLVELPGLSKEEIEITVEDKVLTLSGERRWEEEEDRNCYRRIERSYGSFSRSFTLPGDVAAEGIEATAKDGVLTITLPKAAESKPKRIEIH